MKSGRTEHEAIMDDEQAQRHVGREGALGRRPQRASEPNSAGPLSHSERRLLKVTVDSFRRDTSSKCARLGFIPVSLSILR